MTLAACLLIGLISSLFRIGGGVMLVPLMIFGLRFPGYKQRPLRHVSFSLHRRQAAVSMLFQDTTRVFC